MKPPLFTPAQMAQGWQVVQELTQLMYAAMDARNELCNALLASRAAQETPLLTLERQAEMRPLNKPVACTGQG